MLRYHVGTVINEYKTWGGKFSENLAADIRIAFLHFNGAPVRKTEYTAKSIAAYSGKEFIQQAAAQILLWYIRLFLIRSRTQSSRSSKQKNA